jgi:hypothetical protein
MQPSCRSTSPARAPNRLRDRVASWSCEQSEARRVKLLELTERGATKECDANPRCHDGSQPVRCSRGSCGIHDDPALVASRRTGTAGPVAVRCGGSPRPRRLRCGPSSARGSPRIRRHDRGGGGAERAGHRGGGAPPHRRWRHAGLQVPGGGRIPGREAVGKRGEADRHRRGNWTPPGRAELGQGGAASNQPDASAGTDCLCHLREPRPSGEARRSPHHHLGRGRRERPHRAVTIEEARWDRRPCPPGLHLGADSPGSALSRA